MPALVALLVLDAGYVLWRLSSLRDVGTLMNEGAEALRSGDVELASSRFSTVQERADSASSATNHPAFLIASVLPWIGSDADTVDVLVETARDGARGASKGVELARSIGVSEDGVAGALYSDGQVDLELVAGMRPELSEISGLLEQALLRLDDAPDPHLGVLDSALADARREISEAEEGSTNGIWLSDLLPGFLGGDGERRYLLVMLSPSEARGSGGIVGLHGILTARAGRISVSSVAPPPLISKAAQQEIDAPDWYRARYRIADAFGDWRQTVLSPEFPTVAQVLLESYRAESGDQLDGVLAMDPIALGEMSRGTGPLSAPGSDVEVTSSNATEVILRDSYEDFPTPEAQNVWLGGIVDDFMAKATSDSLEEEGFGEGLSNAVRTGHMKLYSSVADEQSAIQKLDADGGFADEGPNTMMVITQNIAINKVDYFLHRTVDTEIELHSDGSADVTTVIDLVNEAPDGPASTLLGLRSRPGLNQMALEVLMPEGALLKDFKIEGTPPNHLVEREVDRPIVWDWVFIPPGGSKRVEVTYEVPELADAVREDGGEVSLTLYPQTLVNPDAYRLKIIPPAGFSIGGEGIYEREGTLTEPTRVAVHLEPG